MDSWSFSYQRNAVAYWEGELEGLSTTGAWIYFGGYLLETYSWTQQIVALSTTESVSTSRQDVAHALEIRNVLAECDMTLKMKGKTDGTAGRASAARRGVGRVRHLDGATFVAAAVVGRRFVSLGVCVRAGLENTTRQT